MSSGEINLPSWSYFLIPLIAVGEVYKCLTKYQQKILWCFDMILQNIPASGVPMGFPSNRTDLTPLSKGA